MTAARRPRSALVHLPLRALYPLGQLATAVGLSDRRLEHLLEKAGVELLRSGWAKYVPLSELEQKVRPLWESIKSAEMIRRAIEECGAP
jgi:hypothetical protein